METIKKSITLYNKLIYILFFVIVYLFSVYFLFPYQKIKDNLEVRIGKVTGCDVKIKEVTFSIFSGLKLIDMSIDKTIKDTSQNILNINELTIIPYYLSLMSDNINLKLDSNLYGGHLEGTINILRNKKMVNIKSLNLKIDNIDISQNNIIKNLYNYDVYGLIKADISFSGISNGITDSNGEVDLLVTKGGIKGIMLDNIGSGMFRLDNMKMPDITFDNVKVNLKKEQRILNVRRLEVEGNDINVNVTGNLNLSNNLKMSSTNLGVKFNISEEYSKKDATLSLLEESFKNMKDSDGFYNIKIEGALFNPRIRNL